MEVAFAGGHFKAKPGLPIGIVQFDVASGHIGNGESGR